MSDSRSPHGPDPQADVRAEIEDYLLRRALEFEAEGHPPEEARRLAREAFGDLSAIEAECREIQKRKWKKTTMKTTVESLYWDLRRSLRTLLRKPAHASIAILTLALGIGANAAIFSVVKSVLLDPLPFHEPERLVQVWGVQQDQTSYPVSPADFIDWREADAFSSLSAFRTQGANLLGGDRPVRIRAGHVSGTFFETFGVPAELGSPFGPDPDGTGDRQVVLGHALWERDFGADPAVVGRTLQIDDRVYDVVAVMPASFTFPTDADLWIRSPKGVPEIRGWEGDLTTARDLWYFRVVGRLADGVSLGTAGAEMDAVASRLSDAYPDTNGDRGIRLIPLTEETVGDARTTLLLLLGAVSLVLFVACVNVANLVLVRVLGRSQELAIRASLGASRARLLGVMLAENLWIAVGGVVVGLVLAVQGVGLLSEAAARALPRSMSPGLDPQVIGYGCLLAGLSLLIFTVLPARAAASADPASKLGRSRDGSGSRSTRRTMDLLVAGETALAVVLVLAAGLLLRSLHELQRVDFGFEVREYVSAWIAPPGAEERPDAEAAQYYRAVVEAVEAQPSVTMAALATTHPLSEGPGAGLRGREVDTNTSNVRWQIVTPSYFETLGLRFRGGRGFQSTDDTRSEPVTVINQALADRFFPGEDPVGLVINTGLDGRDAEGDWLWVRVVGVVDNTRNGGPADAPVPTMFRPLGQPPLAFLGSSAVVLARSAEATEAVLRETRAGIWSVDRNVPIYSESVGAAMTERFERTQRLVLPLVGVFGVLALLLGAVGIYGVTSYSVRQRIREVGVRLALGADRSSIVVQQVVRGARPALLGVGLGVVGALGGGRLLNTVLFGVAPSDPATFATVCALFVLVVVAATGVPALRAARTDPAITMRTE